MTIPRAITLNQLDELSSETVVDDYRMPSFSMPRYEGDDRVDEPTAVGIGPAAVQEFLRTIQYLSNPGLPITALGVLMREDSQTAFSVAARTDQGVEDTQTTLDHLASAGITYKLGEEPWSRYSISDPRATQRLHHEQF